MRQILTDVIVMLGAGPASDHELMRPLLGQGRDLGVGEVQL